MTDNRRPGGGLSPGPGPGYPQNQYMNPAMGPQRYPMMGHMRPGYMPPMAGQGYNQVWVILFRILSIL